MILRGDCVFDAADFGKRVRAKRKQLGLTQVQLAEACGVSTTFVSDLERGKQTAELGKSIILANMLGLDVVIIDREAAR